MDRTPPPQSKTINFEDLDDTNEGLVEMVSLCATAAAASMLFSY